MDYSPNATMRDARHAYYMANDFGEDGGESKRVVWVDFGPLRFPVPNTKSRKHAVRYHDFHHVLTGYHTDWQGEFEISGWEIGAGCADAWFAWFINLQGLLLGMMFLPRRTIAAFVRGRHSQSLYRYDHDSLLEMTVATARDMTGVDQATVSATARDLVSLGFWFLVSLLLAVLQLGLLVAPIILILWVI